jgi:hypothetical protein
MAVENLTGLTSADVEVLVAPAVWGRGRDYHQQGYVVATLRLADCIAGKVLGAHGVYHARLWTEAGVLRGECGCPYPGFCKHLVALALTWLEQRDRFRDLQPDLEKMLLRPELLPEVLRRLIAKDPVNFGEILSEQSKWPDEAPDRRALVALFRQLFAQRLLTQRDAELLWERLQRARLWLTIQLPGGDPRLPEYLADLLNGALSEYRLTRNELLRGYLAELLELIRSLPQYYEAAVLGGLWQSVCAVYFNPECCWELAEDFRRVIVAFVLKDPSDFGRHLQTGLEPSLPLLGQIAWYELLAGLPREVKPDFEPEYQEVNAALMATAEGRLWLIDRWLETDRKVAKKLIVTSLKESGASERPLWRERLIRLHLLNEEWQQAAALIIIQFSAEPSFEGYLRLKECLARRHPGDWERRLRQVRRLLTNLGERELWLRIVIDRRDAAQINDYLEELVANPVLLDYLAESLNQEPLPALAPVYPTVVRALLDRDNVNDWQFAWQTLVTFKKICYGRRMRREWEDCRAQLLESLDPDQLKSLKRFGGSIMSS